ncbi:transcriptional regulator GutM [Paenibacillus jilunlii]|uniref:Glucitol operon activator protein (GutM) n=1 Tax=Paenibacillus jilunlii TaxID=682956 RepID=A0A1G9PM80_9BACL|nr:transcriptional regulator GutM [Paenibacillus jilunlii]SDL99683.1 Glucitol operon activator protein (GutM) [Paenibacillus jilunlii]
MAFLIITAALAWLLQGMPGPLQIRNFNKKYTELRKLGRVAIGKKTGKIKAGTVVMFAIDSNARILQAAQMQGVTVFSRVQRNTSPLCLEWAPGVLQMYLSCPEW